MHNSHAMLLLNNATIERRSQDRRQDAKLIALRMAAFNIIMFGLGFLVATYVLTK